MKDNTTPQVGMLLAFSWTCPSCGQKQYVDAVFGEVTPEDQAEARARGDEAPVTGEWVTHPDDVACTACGRSYEAVNAGQHAPV